MTEDHYNEWDDEDFRPDPECDSQPLVAEGTYSHAEYQCRIVSLEPRKVPTRRGEVPFASLSVLIVDPEQGAVFARTGVFTKPHTQLTQGSRSSWKQFASQLGIDAYPQNGEGVGAYWERVADEVRDMPVTVTVGVDSYENKTTKEIIKSNYIRNVVKE